MNAVNMVYKLGLNDGPERGWLLPSEVIEPLSHHVGMTPAGWIKDMWPVTPK